MLQEISGWFESRLPKEWSGGPVEVSADSEEILVVVSLPEVELAAGTSPEARAAARNARIDRFREETREERVRTAREAERRFRRKVAWGARCSDEEKVFTTISVPAPAKRQCECACQKPQANGIPAGEPDFSKMTTAEKIAWHKAKWDRVLG